MGSRATRTRALLGLTGRTGRNPSLAILLKTLLIAGLFTWTGCGGGGGALASKVQSALPSGSTLPTRPPTQAPTQAPTTQAPTTQAPTTQAPTTQAPTTQAPTTKPPTTQPPTTQPPTTQTVPTTQVTPTSVAPSTSAPPSSASSSSSPWVWVALAALLAILVAALVARRLAARNEQDPALAEVVRSGTQAHDRLEADLAIVTVDHRIPAGLAESERLLDVFAGQLAGLSIRPDEPGLLAARADLSEVTGSLRASLQPMLGVTSLSLDAMAQDATTHLRMFEAALGRFREAAEAPRPNTG